MRLTRDSAGRTAAVREGLHPQAGIGKVCLVTRRAEVLADFYRDRLGLRELRRRDGTVWLGVGQRDLLVLREDPAATAPSRVAGLYHLALRLPDRSALAAVIRHLLDTDTKMDGFADHVVSEAAYLRDTDGNGVELYADRAREAWYQDGALAMTTLPLDVLRLLAKAPATGSRTNRELPPQTIVGHVHLRVSDLEATERFYTNGLGFQVMMHFGSEGAFLSAGGYHHHLGFNTWGGPFAPRPEKPASGLGYYTIRLPDAQELKRTAARLAQAGVSARSEGEGLAVRDPSGILVLLEDEERNR